MTTLNDVAIKAEISRGRLIIDGDNQQVSGACYELRLGKVYYDLTEDAKRIEVSYGQNILIKPGHRVVLITHEKFDMPANLLARVVNKGSLFTIGLSPVATYADPGFKGHFGIVTQNISDSYISLPQLESIAKVDFTQLTGDAEETYRGQHGYETEIWPIKKHLQKSYNEVKSDTRVGSEKDENYLLLPRTTARVLRSLEFRQAIINTGTVFFLVLVGALYFLSQSKLLEGIQSVITSIIASTIVGLVVWFSRRTP